MNKDLMMRSAIKYQGKWPVGFASDYTCLATCITEIANVCKLGEISIVSEKCHKRYWDIFCTREQFKVFVESLFEGAPDDATHVDSENTRRYYKYDGSKYHLIIGDLRPVRSKKFDKLIPRPAKKLFIGDTPQQLKEGVTPKTPYMPKVGDECEYSTNGHKWHVCKPLCIGSTCVFVKSHKASVDAYKEYSLPIDYTEFRPLRTERELFVEAATAAYLKKVGSDAVDKKWFGRIFGALHDGGFKAP